MSFPIGSERAIRLSENFDYLNVSGSTFYYADTEKVSSSNNIGSVTVGNSLSRRGPSWVISAGTSNLEQKKPATVPAATAVLPPAGGTGATAGAFDTAANRDLLIATVTNLVSDVEALRQAVKAKN